MWKDPIVEDVRKARNELAAQFDYDIQKIVEDAQNRQGSDGRRVASFAAEPHNNVTPPNALGSSELKTAR